MADTRVLSVRLTSEEYELLQSLSLVTGSAVNTIIRTAVVEKAGRAIEDPEFRKQAEATKRRVEEADASLRERVLAAAGAL